MSFLKKFGAIALKVTQVAIGVAPVVSQIAPSTAPAVSTATDGLSLIAQIIMQVEVAGQALALPGTDKLKAAGPLVAQAVLASSLMAGKKIADPELFRKATEGIASSVADLLNSLDEKALKAEEKKA